MKLTQARAQTIIDQVALGLPASYNHHYYSSGLERLLATFEREYFASYLPAGGAVFKLLVGAFGSGKTHTCYALRDAAWRHHFAVAYVPLEQRSSFAELSSVYRDIASNLTLPPHGYVRPAQDPIGVPELLPDEPLPEERGISSVVRSWYAKHHAEVCREVLEPAEQDTSSTEITEINGTEINNTEIKARLRGRLADMREQLNTDNANLTRALLASFEALIEGREHTFDDLSQWLAGTSFNRVIHKKQHGILEPVSDRNALSLLCGLSEWLQFMGYQGLVVLFDQDTPDVNHSDSHEASNHHSKHQNETATNTPDGHDKAHIAHLANLLTLVNETANQRMQALMLLYAVPDTKFLQGGAQVYEALNQRLSSVFDSDLNPSGVRLLLEQVLPNNSEYLSDIGYKLAYLHEVAYHQPFEDEDALENLITRVAERSLQRRYLVPGYRRLFVQALSSALTVLRQEGRTLSHHELERLMVQS